MYYVYMLIDPRNAKPFYVGKGTGNRAQTHLWEIPATRNIHKENKIKSIRKQSLEPMVEYVADNIMDETIAYEIESKLIKKYGRKGYEPNGILTNICLDSRPPNHKGKTYEEIYGSKERADEQRKLRADKQKARGGYGPKSFSKDIRNQLSQMRTGERNPMYGKHHSEESKVKIIRNRILPTGEDHYLSKKWKITSADGKVYEQTGNLQGLCEKLGISFSTMWSAYNNNRIPSRGPSKGWKIETL